MSPKTIVFLLFLVAALAKSSHLDLQRRAYKDLSPHIIGGSEAPKASYPYIVSLQYGHIGYDTMHFCAGSIFNSQWIITAAHCLNQIPINNFIVKAGKRNIKIVESTEQTVEVEQAFVHEKYSTRNFGNDIGLIKLKTPLNFTKEIQPIELPQAESEPTGVAYLCGWGYVLSNYFKNLEMPDKLQDIKLYYINRDVCDAAVTNLTGFSGSVGETNICTGPITGGISGCNGDSGGPLISRYGEKPVLTGIASWIIAPCGTYGSPTVYTKVSKFNAWIKQKIATHTTRLYRYIN
ncbi:serine protease 1 [Anoplolepis gracilipes]|uniref:serine protease 1 n=1 Tax=Anoplolepis gracilipes TaxID=354296 RepID=UPI003BA2A038